jgi:hypothetical protein
MVTYIHLGTVSGDFIATCGWPDLGPEAQRYRVGDTLKVLEISCDPIAYDWLDVGPGYLFKNLDR